MRLKYKTGIEFTWCHGAALPKDDAYSNLIKGSIEAAGYLLREAGLRPRDVDTQDCLEVNFAPFTSMERVLYTYRRACAALAPLGFTRENKYHGTGGGHIHQSGFITHGDEVALIRLVTLHPEINWAFNDPEDIWNARSWITHPHLQRRDLFGAPRALWTGLFWDGHFPDFSHQRRSEMQDKTRAVHCSQYGTMEHRYFGAPVTEEELYHQVMFAERLSAYAERQDRLLLRTRWVYPKPRALALKGMKHCLNSFLALIEELGLRPMDYLPIAKPRMADRFAFGTAQ